MNWKMFICCRSRRTLWGTSPRLKKIRPGAPRPLRRTSFKESGSGQYFPTCYFYRLVRIYRGIHLISRPDSSGVASSFCLLLFPLCFHVRRRLPFDSTSLCAYPVPKRQPDAQICLVSSATVSGSNPTHRRQWNWMPPAATCTSYARPRNLHGSPTPRGILNRELRAASPNPRCGSGRRSNFVNACRALL